MLSEETILDFKFFSKYTGWGNVSALKYNSCVVLVEQENLPGTDVITHQ